ncbi:hypothetical protein BDP27DRAFT_1404740 [Rhodocollybia butyracea]|uniref:Uncharacterized protein n=1 Tax=Rhodocollybia butyracea TaxID=206335 RepID=A0A9P5PM16_9AGAR|nr:hypothetical protein BDP27DRAFT_1404740 [Rhodocollybia butyracea]
MPAEKITRRGKTDCICIFALMLILYLPRHPEILHHFPEEIPLPSKETVGYKWNPLSLSLQSSTSYNRRNDLRQYSEHYNISPNFGFIGLGNSPRRNIFKKPAATSSAQPQDTIRTRFRIAIGILSNQCRRAPPLRRLSRSFRPNVTRITVSDSISSLSGNFDRWLSSRASRFDSRNAFSVSESGISTRPPSLSMTAAMDIIQTVATPTQGGLHCEVEYDSHCKTCVKGERARTRK